MDRRSKDAGAASKKDNNKKSAKPNQSSSQIDEFTSSDGDHIVSEA